MTHAWIPSWILFLTLEDTLEIALFILAFRQISMLAHRQKDPRVLLSWYSYNAAIIGAYQLNLQAIMFLMIILLPALITLGIIIHEKRVQQALIAYERFDAVSTIGSSSTWVDELMSFCLQRINQCYDVHVLMEQKHSLSVCLTAEVRLDGRFSRRTMELLVSAYHKDDILWMSTDPSLVSHAARWREKGGHFLEQAAHVSATLDCIALRACATTRRFTLAVQGKIIENLSAHHALTLLQELCGTLRSTPFKGDNHGIYAHQASSSRASDTHIS